MKTSSPTYSPKSPPILDIQDLYISKKEEGREHSISESEINLGLTEGTSLFSLRSKSPFNNTNPLLNTQEFGIESPRTNEILEVIKSQRENLRRYTNSPFCEEGRRELESPQLEEVPRLALTMREQADILEYSRRPNTTRDSLHHRDSMGDIGRRDREYAKSRLSDTSADISGEHMGTETRVGVGVGTEREIHRERDTGHTELSNLLLLQERGKVPVRGGNQHQEKENKIHHIGDMLSESNPNLAFTSTYNKEESNQKTNQILRRAIHLNNTYRAELGTRGNKQKLDELDRKIGALEISNSHLGVSLTHIKSALDTDITQMHDANLTKREEKNLTDREGRSKGVLYARRDSNTNRRLRYEDVSLPTMSSSESTNNTLQSKYKRNKLQLKEWKERHIKLQKQFDNFREIKNSQVKTMDDEIKHLRDINSILESTQLGNETNTIKREVANSQLKIELENANKQLETLKREYKTKVTKIEKSFTNTRRKQRELSAEHTIHQDKISIQYEKEQQFVNDRIEGILLIVKQFIKFRNNIKLSFEEMDVREKLFYLEKANLQMVSQLEYYNQILMGESSKLLHKIELNNLTESLPTDTSDIGESDKAKFSIDIKRKGDDQPIHSTGLSKAHSKADSKANLENQNITKAYKKKREVPKKANSSSFTGTITKIPKTKFQNKYIDKMVNSTKPQKVIKDHSFSKETLSFLRQKVLKLENKVTDLQQTHPFPIAIHKVIRKATPKTSTKKIRYGRRAQSIEKPGERGNLSSRVYENIINMPETEMFNRTYRGPFFNNNIKNQKITMTNTKLNENKKNRKNTQ